MGRFAIALACAALLAPPLGAQTQTRPAPGAAPSAAPSAGQTWYRQQLLELAGVLGGAHYLRILCSGREDQQWRDFMRGVMQREPAMTGALRDAFNDGYRSEETRFPACNPASQQMEAELRARGLRIAGGLRAMNAE